MRWHSLTDTVDRFTDLPPADAGQLRERAGLLAVSEFGLAALSNPASINVAALALSLRERKQLTLRPAISRLIHNTDLHSIPAAPPHLLQAAGIIEASKPERRQLFGSTASLGWYQLDGSIYLVGLQYPDGVAVTRWSPTWSGEDLTEGVQRESHPLIECDPGEYLEWGKSAARFLIVLGLMLESEGAPIRVKRESGMRVRKGWDCRAVHLDDEVTSDPVGKLVTVTGHIKRQRHGPGHSLVKWIYVAAYQARRWVAPPVR